MFPSSSGKSCSNEEPLPVFAAGVEASDGAQALDLVRQGPDRFDLALLDLQMPNLSGEATFDRLRTIAPRLRVIIWSGYAAGQDLNAVYKSTYAAMKPKYGHWVIFDHCMPFDVTRCFDEMTKHADPRVWTAERDRQMWETLEG